MTGGAGAATRRSDAVRQRGTGQAVAVRRGRFFVASYTATVANDGSFTFDAGHQHVNDSITTADAIDLRVLDAVSKAIIAVIPLTPFVSADGKSFLAPADRDSTFTSPEGIRVFVPEGAFEIAMLVRVEPATSSAFDSVRGNRDFEPLLRDAVELQ